MFWRCCFVFGLFWVQIFAFIVIQCEINVENIQTDKDHFPCENVFVYRI